MTTKAEPDLADALGVRSSLARADQTPPQLCTDRRIVADCDVLLTVVGRDAATVIAKLTSESWLMID